MTIEIFGRQIDRDLAEAIADAIIEACNTADGDVEAEREYDEDDQRQLEKAA